jgi:hypothetical protein
MLSRTTRIRSAAFLLLVAYLGLTPSPADAQGTGPGLSPWPAVQDAAPDFTLDTVDGLPFRLREEAAGRPIVLQFAGCT